MEIKRKQYADLERLLFTEEEIRSAVQTLGARISADYEDKEPLLICVLKGACVFFSDLIRAIDTPVSIDFIAASSYGGGTRPQHEVILKHEPSQSVKGRDVILVEDIMDTGNTLLCLKRFFEETGAASVRIAALLDKPSRRCVPLQPDYACFTIPDAFVVGYGLDYDEQYRSLPEIGILSPTVWDK